MIISHEIRHELSHPTSTDSWKHSLLSCNSSSIGEDVWRAGNADDCVIVTVLNHFVQEIIGAEDWAMYGSLITHRSRHTENAFKNTTDSGNTVVTRWRRRTFCWGRLGDRTRKFFGEVGRFCGEMTHETGRED